MGGANGAAALVAIWLVAFTAFVSGVGTYAAYTDSETATATIQAADDFTETVAATAERGHAASCAAPTGKNDVRVAFDDLPDREAVESDSFRIAGTSVTPESVATCEGTLSVWFAWADVKKVATETNDTYRFAVIGAWSFGRDFRTGTLTVAKHVGGSGPGGSLTVQSVSGAGANATGTQNGTAANETLTNETVGNETLTNETLTNETVGNETLTNETAGNETLTNETVENETQTNETATNETATDETTTNETVENETLTNETSGTDETTSEPDSANTTDTTTTTNTSDTTNTTDTTSTTNTTDDSSSTTTTTSGSDDNTTTALQPVRPLDALPSSPPAEWGGGGSTTGGAWTLGGAAGVSPAARVGETAFSGSGTVEGAMR